MMVYFDHFSMIPHNLRRGNHPQNPGCRTGAGWAKPLTGEAVIERTLVEVATP